MPMSPRTSFHCETTSSACSSKWNGQYVLCDYLLTNQIALSFNTNILTGYIFIARPN